MLLMRSLAAHEMRIRRYDFHSNDAGLPEFDRCVQEYDTRWLPLATFHALACLVLPWSTWKCLWQPLCSVEGNFSKFVGDKSCWESELQLLNQVTRGPRGDQINSARQLSDHIHYQIYGSKLCVWETPSTELYCSIEIDCDSVWKECKISLIEYPI